MTRPSAASSATCVSPSRPTIVRASSPPRHIFSKTSFAILPLIVPSSMRTNRPARRAGVTGELRMRSEEHTSELQSHHDLVCRLLLEKKKNRLHGLEEPEVVTDAHGLELRHGDCERP